MNANQAGPSIKFTKKSHPGETNGKASLQCRTLLSEGDSSYSILLHATECVRFDNRMYKIFTRWTVPGHRQVRDAANTPYTVYQRLIAAMCGSVDGFVEVWDYESGKLCKDLKVSSMFIFCGMLTTARYSET